MKPISSSSSDKDVLAPAIKMIVPVSIVEEFSTMLSESQYYFIHLLVKKTLESDKPLHAFYPLKITYLVNQLGSKPRERQIQRLIDLGIVAVQMNTDGTETYEKGRRAKAYQLTERYRLDIKNDLLKGYFSKSGSPLSKRLRRIRLMQKKSSIENYPWLQREYDWLQKMGFDEVKARDFQEEFEQSGFRGDKPYTRQASLRLESDISILGQLKSGDLTFNYNGPDSPPPFVMP